MDEKKKKVKTAKIHRQEILADITKYEEEIQQAIKLRDEAYNKLKDKNYDLVRPLKD